MKAVKPSEQAFGSTAPTSALLKNYLRCLCGVEIGPTGPTGGRPSVKMLIYRP